jgi:hypothetical protein
MEGSLRGLAEIRRISIPQLFGAAEISLILRNISEKAVESGISKIGGFREFERVVSDILPLFHPGRASRSSIGVTPGEQQ